MYPGLPSSYAGRLLTHHSMRVKVSVLDLAMNPVGSPLGARIVDGSVQVDANAEVTRAASLVLLDPQSQLNFDSDSPADGALYADRMLRIEYGIRVPGAAWVDVPVITGPVNKFSRNGARVSVEVQGKELLAKGSAWRTRTYKKGASKVEVIEAIMREEGERHFALGPGGGKLPADLSITFESVPWEVVQKIARSMGKQLFYDGYGRLTLRDYPGTSVFTFATGTGGSIRTIPTVDFLVDSVRNAVRVVGKKPKGAKKKVSATAVASPDHPLSPSRLGRNGQPRYLAEFIEDTNIGTDAECRKLANARLNVLLASLVEVRFDTLAIPHLDAGDLVTVRTDRFSMGVRLANFTIPLTAGGSMSVGYNKRSTPNRKAIR